jgi:hypothetical protein
MFVKEQGWILVIDQASNAAGVSLWFNGELRGVTTLLSKSPKDPMSRRLQHQVTQLDSFLNAHLPVDALITKILFEGVRSRLVLVTVGAFLTCGRIHAKMSPTASFVESSTWKAWARRHGAQGEIATIKGIKALREVGFPIERYSITTDDESDSCLMYMAWKERP